MGGRDEERVVVSDVRAVKLGKSLRGSRKHVLDWTSTPEFLVELLQLVAPIHARVSAASQWMPRGHNDLEEARLETFGPKALPDAGVWAALRTWWLAHEEGANTPNWDIALSCEIEDRPGLVLVEAKANAPELSALAKARDENASSPARPIMIELGWRLTKLARISRG